MQENAICQYVTSAVPGKEKEAAFLEQAVPKLRGGLQCVLPGQLTVHKAALEFVTPEKREVRETRNLDTFFSFVSSVLQAALNSRCLCLASHGSIFHGYDSNAICVTGWDPWSSRLVYLIPRRG